MGIYISRLPLPPSHCKFKGDSYHVFWKSFLKHHVEAPVEILALTLLKVKGTAGVQQSHVVLTLELCRLNYLSNEAEVLP